MEDEAMVLLETGKGKAASKGRLFLLSNNSSHPLSHKKSTTKKATNRKTKVVCGCFEYEGVSYEVNVKKSGIYKEIMHKVLEQLLTTLAIHKRLLVVRFDLHSSNFSAGNEEISLFRKQIVQWVKRTYQTHSIGFVWVREQERAKAQHYHLAIFIDGDKIRHPKRLLKEIRDKWEAKDPTNHHKPYIESPYYFINSDEALRKAIYRLSYLAKVRGKGYRSDQVKDYATSRLKAPIPMFE
ncbi:MAG: inovirus-type Gp2 protein [Ghiorsea sp.]